MQPDPIRDASGKEADKSTRADSGASPVKDDSGGWARTGTLSVAEAARVLGVQRPTIYAWERGDVPARKNVARLGALFDLASHWRSLSDEPVGALRKEVVTKEGKTLVALLSEPWLRTDTIKSAMTSLLSMQKQEFAARPLAGADLAHRFGFRPLSPPGAARNAAREAKGRPGWRGDKA